MTLLTVLEAINYALILFFGLFLSSDISGELENDNQRKFLLVLFPVFLIMQAAGYFVLGADIVEKMYPIIVHLPLLLVLTLLLKKPVALSAVSIFTAYLCCQLPRWVYLTVVALTGSQLVGHITYAVAVFPIFILLRRFFAPAAYDAISNSRQSLLLFGSLPFAYYVFDYFTSVYSDILYTGGEIINEFLSTALILFYIVFLAAYYLLSQKRMTTELQSSMLESQFRRAQAEIDNLRSVETQAAIYQHDMRHYLTMLDGLLSFGKTEQASDFIKNILIGLDTITPKRFCENETVNLLCSSFFAKAENMGIELAVNAKLSNEFSISDTELCSVISNGLENALNAAAKIEGEKKVSFYCVMMQNRLLIEIKNPCEGEVLMRNGLPVSDKPGHGYGCRSIRGIVERRRGLCTFDAENGIFTLRIVLPPQKQEQTA